MLAEAGLVFVQPVFELPRRRVDGGERGAFGQPQFDIEFETGRVREKLLLHLRHADDGQREK